MTYIIAEAGINHNGSLELAKKLISLAKNAGCDSVKFQKRTLDICIPENQREKIRDTPWGEMSYFEYKKKIEFDKEEFDVIDSFCKKLQIDWSASAWDHESLEFVENYKPPYHKVPSALNTNIIFLREVAKLGRKTLVSTGMCNLSDIDEVVNIFNSVGTELILMHSVSTYPAREENLNLNFIKTLQKRYKLDVGYSGHEASVSPSIVAAVLGANYIERHITLDRSMWGTDHSASLELTGLTQLVGSIRKLPAILGNGNKVFLEDEKIVAEKMRYW
jgi:N-acetylneuraminate synthase